MQSGRETLVDAGKQRPWPPASLVGVEGALAGPAFEPAPDLVEWALTCFVEDGAPAYNPAHGHLAMARIGCLWTNVPNSRHDRSIVGQAEFRPPGGTMGKWARGRAQAQLHGWFGGELDFLLTFDAAFAAECTDAQFCALVEHELYHCGQAKDEFGAPKFIAETGMPVFCMRGHDVEEFVGVVERYGALSPSVAALAAAAVQAPSITAASIAGMCGTCAR